MTPEQRQSVRLRLAELESKGGGRLTPDAVVQDAKSKDSPLHPFFEWDIKKAAHAYWVEQARDLITRVRVEVRTEHTIVRVPAYSRDPSADTHEQGYVSIKRLRSDEDLAREALVDAFARVGHVLEAARRFAKALGAEQDVEALVGTVTRLRDRFAAGAVSG